MSTDGGMTARWNPEMMYKPLPKEASRRGGGTRDPMILWYAPEKKWVMVVYNQAGGRNGFYFFESKDLKNWAETSVLDDMYECPNLFQLAVDGNKADMRWVTWGSSTEYLIGKFNGRAFVPDDNRRLRAHYGDFSASQVFANAPGGRIVQIGWAHCGESDGAFCWMAAFPLDLSLRTTPEGLRLCAELHPRARQTAQAGQPAEGCRRQGRRPAHAWRRLAAGGDHRRVRAGNGLASQLHRGGTQRRLERPEPGTRGQWREDQAESDQTVASCCTSCWTSRRWRSSPAAGDYIIKARDYRKLGEKSPLEIRAEGGDVKFSRLEVYPLQIDPWDVKERGPIRGQEIDNARRHDYTHVHTTQLETREIPRAGFEPATNGLEIRCSIP